MDLHLQDKVAFVSGSSRGVGLAIARRFLDEGARATITGRGAEDLERARRSIVSASDQGRVLAVQADMTDRSDIDRALDETARVHGGIDAVVATVGVSSGNAGWDLDEDDWSLFLSSNLLGGTALATMAMPYLLNAKAGSLTFISSIAASESIGAPIPYGAAKAAVDSSMKSLSRLVGPEGVRVNSVSPGNMLYPGGVWERKLKERREFFEEMVRREVPLQRFASPEEIADVVVFLASERAGFVTGSSVVVDGGQTRSY